MSTLIAFDSAGVTAARRTAFGRVQVNGATAALPVNPSMSAPAAMAATYPGAGVNLAAVWVHPHTATLDPAFLTSDTTIKHISIRRRRGRT